MKKFILQYTTNDQKNLLDLVKPTNQTYAYKFGFEYVTDSTTHLTDRVNGWEKIAYINNFLLTADDDDLVVWEDVDSLNLGDISFEDALPTDGVLGMVQLRAGLGGAQLIPWYNSGVIIFVVSDLTRDYFKRVWERDGKTDEDGLVNELKYTNWIVGNGKTLTSLDPKWNCWRNNDHLCKTPVVKSFHGMKLDKKEKAIKDALGV